LRCRALRLLFASAVLLICETALAGETCTYTDWTWHVPSGQAVDFREVVTMRDALTAVQKHETLDCSICREDMTEVNVPGQPAVFMCHVIAPAVEAALIAAQDSGFEIESLTGYRVGRTKGPLDEDGRRTEYSHHSFGLAIDINADKNGLYDRCIEFGPACRLRRGGVWRPGSPGTITPETPIYQAMQDIGLRWGGELQGWQKEAKRFHALLTLGGLIGEIRDHTLPFIKSIFP